MSVTLPPGIKLPKAGLLESLGKGLGAGFQQGTTLGTKLTQALMLQKQKQKEGLTQYQQLSTLLREREQQRKTKNAVTGLITKLTDPLYGGIISGEDIPNLSSTASDLISEGMDPQTALSQTIGSYTSQKDLLNEIKFPSYSERKVKQNQEMIVNQLRENNITNPNLINRTLKAKKYPWTARQNIIKNMSGIQKPEITPEAKEELKPLSREELMSLYEQSPGTTPEQKKRNLQKILESKGYKVTGI